MFGYGSAGVSLCAVGYLITQEIPKIVKAISSASTTESKKTITKTPKGASTGYSGGRGGGEDSAVSFSTGYITSPIPVTSMM